MKTLFYILVLLLPFQLSAQQHISGLVNDEQGKPLDAATITISKDGKVLSSQLADQGKFSFSNLSASSYQLSVSLVGYQTLLRTFSLPKDSLKLRLLNDSRQLQEVAITFKKPTIERKPDKVIFNVENSIMASGGSVWEALSKAPGVQTTNEGAVKANNKGATVYMDGKPVRLSGDDLTAYLQSIPADNLSKIEVMANPSSKYEAQGGAVINIISKKIKADGFNASLSAAYTRAERNRYTGNGVFNYRKDKLNVFGSYGYSDRDMVRKLDSYTIYQSPGAYAYWDMKRKGLSASTMSNYTAGADYNLTENQVLGVLVTGNNSVNTGYSNGLTNVYNNYNPRPDSVLNTMSKSNGAGSQYSFNLNYKVKLDSSGRSLNIDVDYSPFSKDNTQDLQNLSMLPNGNLSSAPYQISFPARQEINIWSGKVDYQYKLAKIWTMESGLKYTSTTSKNQFDFYNTAAAIPVLDLSKTDRFKYTENTAAIYSSVSGAIEKWTFKGGLRAEYTYTKGLSQSLDSINIKKYYRVFPTVFVTYKASDHNEFGFTYSKRIERPDYRQLNPAKSYSTQYTSWSGNPFLKPSIINNLQFSYTIHQNYTVAAVYTQIDDMSSNVTIQDNINKTNQDVQQNIGSIKDLGIELSAVQHPFSWWEINHTGQAYYRRQSSDQPGNTYNYQQYYFYVRTDHAFTIAKNSGLKAEIGAWYNSAVQQGTLRVNKTYDLSALLSKPLFNKQGTLRFSATDILNGNPYRIMISNNGQNNGIYQQNDTRTFSLSFSYKLGKSVAAARKRTTASEEERRRAN